MFIATLFVIAKNWKHPDVLYLVTGGTNQNPPVRRHTTQQLLTGDGTGESQMRHTTTWQSQIQKAAQYDRTHSAFWKRQNFGG